MLLEIIGDFYNPLILKKMENSLDYGNLLLEGNRGCHEKKKKCWK